MAMSLLKKQFLFSQLAAELIRYIYSKGYTVTLGEAWRTPEQAALNAKSGKGIANSLHTQRLAIDLNLFKDGKWLTNSEDFRLFGEWWEKQSGEGYTCCWGGRFRDGNHFSIEHNGVK